MFKKITVGARLMSGYMLIAFMGAAVALVGISNMASMNESSERAYAADLKGVSSIKEANVSLIAVGRAMRGVLLAATPEQQRSSSDKVEQSMKEMAAQIEHARPLFSSQDGKAGYARLDANMAEYKRVLAKLRAMAEESAPEGKAQAVNYAFNEYASQAKVVDDTMSILSSTKEKEAEENAAEAKRTYESARKIMLIQVLVSVIVGIVIGMRLTRGLTRQLGGEPAYAAEVVAAIAEGDLSTQVAVKPGDVTSLLYGVETMRASLAGIVQQVRERADLIATASAEIASGNQDLSSRTEEQASSLEETASSMEQLTGTVRQNADNAAKADGLAGAASGVAHKGGDVVAQVVQTMSSINESSRKIVEIISVIDSIAFQTNILALNAAVEAARAGEQGRGFAVVASEVRNLAQRSATAAKEIKVLIGDSVIKVEEGGKLVDHAGQTMREIVTSISGVTDIVKEIALASREQSAGIEQVSAAVATMDQVTQQNAALVEEAAAATAAMQDQARSLQQAVGTFKLDQSRVVVATVSPVRARIQAPAAKAAPASKQASSSDTDWTEF